MTQPSLFFQRIAVIGAGLVLSPFCAIPWLLYLTSIREEELREQTTNFVPWSHPLVPILSNVIVMGAFWWSLTRLVTTPRSVVHSYSSPYAPSKHRKPPDPGTKISYKEVLGLNRRLFCEAVTLYSLLLYEQPALRLLATSIVYRVGRYIGYALFAFVGTWCFCRMMGAIISTMTDGVKKVYSVLCTARTLSTLPSTVGPGTPALTLDPRKRKQRLHRQRLKNLRRLKRVLTLTASLPQMYRSQEISYFQSLEPFRDPLGMLLTDRMPEHELHSLRARLMSLSSDESVRDVLDTTGTFPIVIDSGASACSTPDRKDFVPDTYENVHNKHMGGIASSLPIVGRGILRYQVMGDDDKIVTLETWGYHIPDLPIRLLSPQIHLRDGVGVPLAEYSMRVDESSMTMKDGRCITVPYNATTMLPVIYASLDLDTAASQLMHTLTGQITDETNQNLSPTTKTMLRWHQKLNHVGYSSIRWLATQGYLGNAAKVIAKVLDDDVPVCATCQYGKQTRTGAGAIRHQAVPEKIKALSKHVTKPGDLVAIDQYVHTTPGRIPTIGGASPKGQSYIGGTIFVDLGSGRIRVHHQQTLGANETLASKAKYEQDARLHGVQVRNYHADNGVFNAREFTTRIWEQGQNINYSGVGAKHQNGIAERAIKTVHLWARTMMLHSAIRWPEAYSPEYWPFALTHAAHVYNTLPKRPSGLSPTELFSGLKENHVENLAAMQPWGVPVYVLESHLQDGHKIPKWQPRSRRGQFLGVSDYHSSKHVGLVRNLVTQRVTPQYHLVYDPWFETTYAEENKPPADWEDLLMHQRYQCPLDLENDGPCPLNTEWLSPEDQQSRREEDILRQRGQKPPRREQQQRPDVVPRGRDPMTPSIAPLPSSPPEPAPAPAPPPQEPATEPPPPAPDPHIRRSSRTNKGRAAEKLSYDILGGYAEAVSYLSGPSSRDAVYLTQSLMIDPEEATVEEYILGAAIYPWSLAIRPKANRKGRDPDLPMWNQVMAGPYKEEFQKGMDREVNQLIKKDTWVEVARSSLRAGANVIRSTWAFKIARNPDGSVKKFRSRFCARGDTQIEGVDVFETYAPVVSWSTVRMLLTLAVQLDLKTRTIDISNAFVSASLGPEEEIYLEMPRGYEKEDTVLKLKKSLYGLRQSPKMFFEHLSASLQELDFVPSENDQCMFMKEGIIVISYVDDILLFSKEAKLIDEVITGLERTFELTKDDPDQEVFDYLGIGVARETNKNGSSVIALRQLGLTKKVLKTIKDGNLKPILESSHSKEHTPAGKPLGACKDDDDFDEKKFGFSYPSAVGMLMYLVNTRPDIQLAVHQCARFTHAPKAIHGKALRRIARYLHGTMEEGLRLKTTSGPVRFDCYVDADFAGLYGYEDVQDPICVKSRTGYVFTLGGNPIHWVSKLQSTIALSTVEAEYCALSQALREFLPMRRTAEQICKAFDVDIGKTGTLKSTVFEDNSGALSIATAKRVNPRTKHIATVYHWFWDKTGEGTDIEIQKIGTEEQLADIFTKPLVREIFEVIRELVCGW